MSTLSCDQIEQERLLEKYLDNELPHEERDLLESHLRACVKCNPRMRKLRAEKRGGPADLEPVMLPRPEKVTPEASAAKISRATRPLIATAILVVLIAVGFVFWLQSERAGGKAGVPVVVPVQVQVKTDNLQLTSTAAMQELAGFRLLPYSAPINKTPAGMDVQLRTAMQLYEKGQLKEAAGLLQEMLKLAPDFQYARLYLGVCLFATGDNVQAEQALRGVVSGGTTYQDEARFILAKTLFAQGSVEAGAKELRTVAASAGSAGNAAKRLLPLLDQVK